MSFFAITNIHTYIFTFHLIGRTKCFSEERRQTTTTMDSQGGHMAQSAPFSVEIDRARTTCDGTECKIGSEELQDTRI
jgi:hypothetical protein